MKDNKAARLIKAKEFFDQQENDVNYTISAKDDPCIEICTGTVLQRTWRTFLRDNFTDQKVPPDNCPGAIRLGNLRIVVNLSNPTAVVSLIWPSVIDSPIAKEHKLSAICRMGYAINEPYMLPRSSVSLSPLNDLVLTSCFPSSHGGLGLKEVFQWVPVLFLLGLEQLTEIFDLPQNCAEKLIDGLIAHFSVLIGESSDEEDEDEDEDDDEDDNDGSEDDDDEDDDNDGSEEDDEDDDDEDDNNGSEDEDDEEDDDDGSVDDDDGSDDDDGGDCEDNESEEDDKDDDEDDGLDDLDAFLSSLLHDRH